MSEKLQKILAQAGLGSRRELEKWIEAGRVSVNGKVAKLGDRVEPEDTLKVDGRSLAPAQKENRLRVLLYNKPEGEICTRKDPEGRPTVFSSLPKIAGGRWVAVGRLDINTAGLLLFTNNGELANALMHPSSQMEREYLVRVHGEVDKTIKQTLLAGVALEDGIASFSSIKEGRRGGSNQWFSVVLREGRNREVRRLWESQGVEVSRLKRIRFGNITLPSIVRTGQWLELDAAQIQSLCQLAEIPFNAEHSLTPQEKEKNVRHLRKLRARGDVKFSKKRR